MSDLGQAPNVRSIDRLSAERLACDAIELPAFLHIAELIIGMSPKELQKRFIDKPKRIEETLREFNSLCERLNAENELLKAAARRLSTVSKHVGNIRQ